MKHCGITESLLNCQEKLKVLHLVLYIVSNSLEFYLLKPTRLKRHVKYA